MTRQRPPETTAALSGPRLSAVFLDRDGTINVKPPEGDYVRSWREFAFLPGAPQAVALLAKHARRLIVVTNQRGIALGRMTEDDVADIHRRMTAELAVVGARVDGVYHCPHDKGACHCRKPETGLLEQAARDFPDIDFDRSIVIGDSKVDIEAAARTGARGVRIGAEPALDGEAAAVGPEAPVFCSLWEAARWLARPDIPPLNP